MPAIPFHHIVASTYVAIFLLETFDVVLAIVLHIGVGVVKVAAAVEIVACVRISCRFRLSGCIRHFVVAAYPFETDAPRLAVPFLHREIIPVGDAVTVVYDHIGDKSRPFALEGLNHREKLLLCSESGIMVCKPILGHITHPVAFAGIWNPDKFEIF